jgi:hypothetical protein
MPVEMPAPIVMPAPQILVGADARIVMEVPRPMPPILIEQPVWVVPIHTPPVRWVSERSAINQRAVRGVGPESGRCAASSAASIP